MHKHTIAKATCALIVLFGQVSKMVGNGFNSIESGVFRRNLTFCQIGLYLGSQPFISEWMGSLGRELLTKYKQDAGNQRSEGVNSFNHCYSAK